MSFFKRILQRLPSAWTQRWQVKPEAGEELVELEGFNKDFVHVKLHSIVTEIREKHIFDPDLLKAVEVLHFGLTYKRPIPRKYLLAVLPELGERKGEQECKAEEMCKR
jgi:hypothetical protein